MLVGIALRTLPGAIDIRVRETHRKASGAFRAPTLGGMSIMSEPRIILAGMGPKLSGLTWETNKSLRIGRQTNLDVVLRDNSVERLHAEVRHQGMRWIR